MSDILIYGGFNWLGYELTDIFIKGDMVSNIIIIDSMKHHLHKELIRTKFDNYAHLYDVNIFLYILNIEDKCKILEVYNKHNINYVINNIKYNIYDTIKERDEIKVGYQNIKEIHEKIEALSYVYIIRRYSHNKVLLNNHRSAIAEDNIHFNEFISKVSSEIGKEVIIPDYIFGEKKDKHNDIVIKIRNILKSTSSLVLPEDSFFCIQDNDILLHLVNASMFRGVGRLNESQLIGPCNYNKIVELLDNANRNQREDSKFDEYILSLS